MLSNAEYCSVVFCLYTSYFYYLNSFPLLSFFIYTVYFYTLYL